MGHPVKKNSCSSNIVGSTFLQEMQIQSLAKIAEFVMKTLILSTFVFIFIKFSFVCFVYCLFSMKLQKSKSICSNRYSKCLGYYEHSHDSVYVCTFTNLTAILIKNSISQFEMSRKLGVRKEALCLELLVSTTPELRFSIFQNKTFSVVENKNESEESVEVITEIFR